MIIRKNRIQTIKRIIGLIAIIGLLLSTITGCSAEFWDTVDEISNAIESFSEETESTSSQPEETETETVEDTETSEATETDNIESEETTKATTEVTTEVSAEETATEATTAEATTAEETTKDTTAESTIALLDPDGTYTSKEDVSLYIYQYGELPNNFITKKEARELGWEGGSLEPYAPGMCIGGDYFGNYEELLPEAKGREYHECDIDTLGARSRGAKRIIFSNDGLIYYTEDHYESFTLLYGEE